MRAYRINLIGTQDHYLITEKQKPAIEAAMNGKRGMVKIAGDTLRSSAIKSIRQVNVDMESCPDYFVERVKGESASQPGAPTYQKLPSEWITITEDGKILAENIGKATTRLTASKGLNFRYARAHYQIGQEGEREYIMDFAKLADVLDLKPTPDSPDGATVLGLWKYGRRIW